MASNILVVSGRASSHLAKKIGEVSDIRIANVSMKTFSDGEFQPAYEDTIRGKEIFIIQSTQTPADNLLELLMMIDAAKRASAKRVIAVIPYYGYARQDRKDKPRVPITSKLIADVLSAAGVDRLVTMDLHADQIQAFFNIPVDHLYASTIFVPYLINSNIPNLTIAAPDTGGTRRAAVYAKFINAELAITFKQRSREKVNQVDTMTLIGDVKDRNVVIIDDIIDTAGTIVKAAEMMLDNGASSVRAMCTHAILSGHAYDRIEKSRLTELIVTDTVQLKHESSKIRVLSVAELLADVIRRVSKNMSISGHFRFPTIM